MKKAALFIIHPRRPHSSSISDEEVLEYHDPMFFKKYRLYFYGFGNIAFVISTVRYSTNYT